jgi:excisionase family DNA binding protein
MLHTVGEVAELLRVSPRTIHNLVSRGDITPTRIGDRLLFHADEIARFAREGVRSISTKPINRQELDTYVSTLGEGSPLHYVLTAYRDRLDGKAVNVALVETTAIKIGSHLLQTADTKRDAGQKTTEGERLAIKYLGIALQAFSA